MDPFVRDSEQFFGSGVFESLANSGDRLPGFFSHLALIVLPSQAAVCDKLIVEVRGDQCIAEQQRAPRVALPSHRGRGAISLSSCGGTSTRDGCESWKLGSDFYLLSGTAGLTLRLLFVVASLGHRIIAQLAPPTGLPRLRVSPNRFYFSTTLVVASVLLRPDLPRWQSGGCVCWRSRFALLHRIHQAHQRWRENKLPVWIGFGLSGFAFATTVYSPACPAGGPCFSRFIMAKG